MAATKAADGAVEMLFVQRDAGLAIGVVGILMILFLPLPAFLIDLGLAFSIALSMVILMVALWIRRPLEFSAFPTVLLIATLLRLSLNVATTRLILSQGAEGPTAAGHVIAGFAQFVMGGDFVIGIIVFIILVTVNFVVITKGATRIAEVGARFTLDSLPGKQMAVDADLSSGAIDEKEAIRRRRELEEESQFFGAMDGASKFVRGDAIAGLIITAVNIFGGIIIGVTRHDLPFERAVDTFTNLSVGDGLVTQMPALIVSLAAGLTRVEGRYAGVDRRRHHLSVRQLSSGAAACRFRHGGSRARAGTAFAAFRRHRGHSDLHKLQHHPAESSNGARCRDREDRKPVCFS